MYTDSFLVYIDILGFTALSKRIGIEKGIESRRVRFDFLGVIKERIEFAKNIGLISSVHYGDSDEWIITVPTLDQVFRLVFEILDHNTGFEGYSKVPLEIGVGFGQYDEWASFVGSALFVEDSTHAALKKPDIINCYHNWYCKENGKGPNSSYMILSEAVYKKIEKMDKKWFDEISFKGSTFFIGDLKRLQQRGRMQKFLDLIGRSGSKIYNRVDDVFVPPIEYKKIVTSLRNNKAVFIIGAPELGKTYISIRLLWKFFKKGYSPVWKEGREFIERMSVRKSLEEIETELKPHHIIFFEDPFGIEEYEPNKNLEREIVAKLESACQARDAYIVVTSREEVFKEFKERHFSSKYLDVLEAKLNVTLKSYDYKRRKRILLKWAEANDCKWLEKPLSKTFLLQALKDCEILPTPQALMAFTRATINMTAPNNLAEQIKKKSMESIKVFSKEIERFTDDKILFLLFPFFHSLPVDLVRLYYGELVKELGISKPLNFDEVLNWFKDDKIEISGGKIRFLRPSYSVVMKNVLNKNGKPSRISNEIYSKLLFKLSDNMEIAGSIAYSITAKLNSVSESVRNELLIKLSKIPETAPYVAWAISIVFSNLHPEKVRNSLLLELLTKNAVARTGLAMTIEANFDYIPETLRNELLIKLSKNPENALAVALAVSTHFDRLSKKFRDELLFELLINPEAAQRIAKAIKAKHWRPYKNRLRKLMKYASAKGLVKIEN